MNYDDLGDDYEDDDEEGTKFEMFHLIHVTKEQIMTLLGKGQVDVEEIEVECLDCSNEISIRPSLVLKD